MSDPAPLSDEEISDTIRRISKFKVAELKDLARSMELRLTGKKQELNDRIVQFLEQGRRYSDNLKLLTVRTLVLKRQNHDQLPPFKDLYNSIQTGAFNYTNVWNQYMKHDSDKPKSIHATDSTPYKAHSLYFKESPFYHLKRMVHGSPQVAFPSKGRVVCDFHVVLTQEENELLSMNNPSIRFFLLCGIQGNNSPSSTQVLLQFPNPLEIHVNGNLFKENVKGIKGKPGTAKPADITTLLKPTPRLNKIQMVYTTTNDTYLLYLYIVQMISCDDLIRKIVSKPHIHINSTVSQIFKNSADEDDDLVVSTSVVTLKDPLSYTRMTYPAQSIYCTHVECFDALIFLESQKQLPTWSCPHCHKSINIDDLAISDYLLDILGKVSDEVDHVTINQDGSWEVEEDKKEQQDKGTSSSSAVATKKESEDNLQNSEIIEIVSLDSDSEGEMDISMVRPNNMTTQNSEQPNSTANRLDAENGSSIVSNSVDEDVSSYVINDSETDSDDERPLARRNRRPPLISTTSNPSSNSDSSQPHGSYPQMYEFSTLNDNSRINTNMHSLSAQNQGNGISVPNSGPGILMNTNIHPSYNQMTHYPIPNIQQNMQQNMQQNFQSNNHQNAFQPNMIFHPGHPISTSNHRLQSNMEAFQTNNFSNQNQIHQSSEAYTPNANRTGIHPSISQNTSSDLYPKGFQNILNLQQRQQLSQRQLQDKYNEMTLLMQMNIKKADNISLNLQSQSPVNSARGMEDSTTVSGPRNDPYINSTAGSSDNTPNSNNGGANVSALNNEIQNIPLSGNTPQSNGEPNSPVSSNTPNNSSGTNNPTLSNESQTNALSTNHASPITSDPADMLLNETQEGTNDTSNLEQPPSNTYNQGDGSDTVEGHLGMRFSKSVFELSESNKSKADSVNDSEITENSDLPDNPASKKQKIVGLLGITLNDDIFPLGGVSNIASTNPDQEHQVSPINGRINNIQLETPTRKRTLSTVELDSTNNSNSESHD